ncbi:MAG: hypothetical protein KW806_01440, partial [Candidatus Yanofskybacteria bacterium]|nr:hypothetical protein [Candidatus Yanofskybacteria bacterium]
TAQQATNIKNKLKAGSIPQQTFINAVMKKLDDQAKEGQLRDPKELADYLQLLPKGFAKDNAEQNRIIDKLAKKNVRTAADTKSELDGRPLAEHLKEVLKQLSAAEIAQQPNNVLSDTEVKSALNDLWKSGQIPPDFKDKILKDRDLNSQKLNDLTGALTSTEVNQSNILDLKDHHSDLV